MARVRPPRFLSMVALDVAVLVTGAVCGHVLFQRPARFPDRGERSIDEVVRLAHDAGVECSNALVPHDIGDPFVAIRVCDGDEVFEVAVLESRAELYRTVDIAAAGLGCIQRAGHRHTQWYLAYGDNWTVMAYEAETATRLMQYPGVAVVTGHCDVGRPTGTAV